MTDLKSLLACPACRGALAWSGDDATCAACGASYPAAAGIPRLVAETDAVKDAQAAWFDSEVDAEYEIERPRGTPRFHAWLLEEKFRRSVDAIRNELPGASVAAVCAGSGLDAEFLARCGARVLAFDISPGAAMRTAERARRHGLTILPIVADTERLPLVDRSVDVAYVHDGLHHLERPLAGLAEMARVARRAVSVTEPARATATALSVRIGYSGSVEEAGNRVERLLPDEVSGVLTRDGFDVAASRRYAMVYRHEAGAPMRLLSLPGAYTVARGGFRLANALLGRVGNKLAVQAVRPGPAPRRILVNEFGGFPFPVELSRELAARGDRVLHLHCPSYPNGRGRLEREIGDPDGFASEPIPVAGGFRKYSLLGRPIDELRYGRVLRRRVHSFRPDLVLSDAPLLVQLAAQRAARSAGSAVVFWQQDVHGLAVREIARRRLGRLAAPVAALYPRLERRLLSRSDAVIAVGDSFLEPLTAWGVRPDRIHVLENWAPIERLPVLPRENAWRAEHGLGSAPVLLYGGTLGLKHDVTLLHRLARDVQGEAVVVVASEGLGADALRDLQLREPLENLVLVPFQPFDRLAEMLAAADVLLALLDRELGSYSVPSKVLTYLCAARPIVAAVAADNPAARMLVETAAGVVVEPEDYDGFLDGARRLLGDATLRETLGAHGRRYAEETFRIASVAERFEKVFELALGSRSAQRPAAML
ncbi:MAG TPA: glycosyltransferase [Gaiellaceae bacterium]|nr:glycosyltransferase [Gaiellaceae bacterium]